MYLKTKLKIEPAKLEDTRILSKIECRCYDVTWHEYVNWFWKRAVDHTWTYKASVDKRIVGGIIALPTRKGAVYIDTLFVKPSFRGRGIAEALLKKVLSISGNRKIQLDAEVYNNTAQKLFAKHGFKKKKILRNHYDEGLDYILLERIR